MKAARTWAENAMEPEGHSRMLRNAKSMSRVCGLSMVNTEHNHCWIFYQNTYQHNAHMNLLILSDTFTECCSFVKKKNDVKLSQSLSRVLSCTFSEAKEVFARRKKIIKINK